MMGYCACHRGGYNDQHGPNPGPIPPADLKQLSEFESDPRFHPALSQYRAVSSNYNTPYLGGSDKSGTTVYQDQRFANRVKQGQVKYDGRPYDPTPFVNLHEAVEGVLIRHFGLDYPHAHKLATAGERLAVESAGGDWGKHTAAMRPEIRLAEKEGGQGTPPDLLVQPYENTKYWGEVTGNEGLKIPAMAGAADQRARALHTGSDTAARPLQALGQAGGGYTSNQRDDRGVQRQADGWPGEPDKGQGAMRFYLIRHGKTKLNKGGATQGDKIRGWADVPLDETGERQAKKLGKQLANSGIEILAHSNLTRSKDTAEAVAKTTGAELVSAPLQLRPWNVGIYTGTDSNSAHPELQRMAIESPDEPIPKGESFTQFKCRVFSGLGELLEKYAGKHVAIVTHHRVERVLHAWLDGGQKEDTSLDFNTMFSHGEDPANADCIAVDPGKLAAAAQTACKELERIGPEKYSQKDAGFHEDHGPPTKAHPEGTHCGVCKFFGGEGKCSQVDAKPNHIGADDGCALFTNPERTQEMRKKGNKSGTGGATNWDEREGPGGNVVGGPAMARTGVGGYDPELPASSPGQQFAGANQAQTMGFDPDQGTPMQYQVGGYGSYPTNFAVGAGGPPKASKPGGGSMKAPHMGGGGKVSINAPKVSAGNFNSHRLALGGLMHSLKSGGITQEQHDKAVAHHRKALTSSAAKKVSPPSGMTPPSAPGSSAGASSGKGGMGGALGLLPYPVSPYEPQGDQAGGYDSPLSARLGAARDRFATGAGGSILGQRLEHDLGSSSSAPQAPTPPMDIRPPQQQLEDALSRVNGGYARMRRGGYGGLGSLDPNFMNQGGQGGGAMGGQKMPWQT